jgi:hypothetical protein
MQSATTRTAGRRIATIAGIAFLPLALCGCVHSRVVRQPAAEEPSHLGWSVDAPDGASLTLRQLIVTNNSGTWVEDALWDEYVVEIRNDGDVAIQLQSLRLESAHLPPQQPLASRELLETATAENMGVLKGAGIVVGVGVVAPLALVATAGGGAGMTAGTLAAAAVANLMVVGLIAGGTYVISKAAVQNSDRNYMDDELARRAIMLPRTLPAGSTISGSAFFAVTPQPTALTLDLRDAGGTRQLVLDLTPLESLALVPLEKPIKAPKPKPPPKKVYAEGEVPPKHNPWACGRCSSRNED